MTFTMIVIYYHLIKLILNNILIIIISVNIIKIRNNNAIVEIRGNLRDMVVLEALGR